MRALALSAFALAGLATSASAQTAVATRPAFSVERLVPAPASGTWVGLEPADVLPAGYWALTFTTSLMSRPMVLRDVQTDVEASEPVRLRWGTDVVAGRGLGSRYLVGLAAPLVVQSGDRLQGIGLSERPLARYAIGDVRLHGRARIAGAPGDRGLGAALAATITLPTGDDDHFAGEAGWMLSWGLRVGYRAPRVEVLANASLRLRTTEVILLSPARPHGNELTVGLGAAFRFDALGRAFGSPDRAWLLAESESTLGDSPGTGARGPSPSELRVSARVNLHHCWSLALGGGGGLTPDSIGSPAWRIFAQLSFDQAPPRDFDLDGIPDARDLCWREPEDRDGYLDSDGCPDPDNDLDTIPDVDDLCPLEPEDLDGYRDTDGCPDAEQTIPHPSGPGTGSGGPIDRND
jgi:hypothetical protein